MVYRIQGTSKHCIVHDPVLNRVRHRFFVSQNNRSRTMKAFLAWIGIVSALAGAAIALRPEPSKQSMALSAIVLMIGVAVLYSLAKK
jgi:hypothetical protein